jgi:hypothetical protein
MLIRIFLLLIRKSTDIDPLREPSPTPTTPCLYGELLIHEVLLRLHPSLCFSLNKPVAGVIHAVVLESERKSHRRLLIKAI